MHITESVYENKGMIIRLLSHFETMKEVHMYIRIYLCNSYVHIYVYVCIYRVINNLILHWMK